MEHVIPDIEIDIPFITTPDGDENWVQRDLRWHVEKLSKELCLKMWILRKSKQENGEPFYLTKGQLSAFFRNEIQVVLSTCYNNVNPIKEDRIKGLSKYVKSPELFKSTIWDIPVVIVPDVIKDNNDV